MFFSDDEDQEDAEMEDESDGDESDDDEDENDEEMENQEVKESTPVSKKKPLSNGHGNHAKKVNKKQPLV